MIYWYNRHLGNKHVYYESDKYTWGRISWPGLLKRLILLTLAAFKWHEAVGYGTRGYHVVTYMMDLLFSTILW